MIPRKRKNKLNQKTLDSLKEPGTYFFNDAPAIYEKLLPVDVLNLLLLFL